jgi:hypothetical protein
VRRFNARDVVLVTVMQAAVIGGGVLLAGQWDKRFLNSGIQAPFPIEVLANYGFLSLVFPLVWLVWMLRIRLSPSVPDGVKIRAFVGGFAFVLATALLFGCVVARAWFVYGQGIDQIIANVRHIS